MEHNLICGEIGIDNFQEFISILPKIDIVYNAPPNQEMMSFWHQSNPVPYTYEHFISSLADIYNEVDADIYAIECGTNQQDIIDILGDYPYFQSMPITYSAPVYANSKRLAKKQIPYNLLIFSQHECEIDFDFKYSHEFLDQFLQTPAPLNLFDPCIGKGLLLRYALKYGHMCHGIECSAKRLQCAIDYLERNNSLV